MLPNCWEIKKCGREKGGPNAHELGVCPAYPNNGHSCWIIAGTFCEGKVQGTFAQKQGTCVVCDVYNLYSTSFGERKDELKREHPEEYEECLKFLRKAGI